jgi:hypothetical protein
MNTVPNYIYYIARGHTSTQAMSGQVFCARDAARSAKRTLAQSNPNTTYRLFRVPVARDSAMIVT